MSCLLALLSTLQVLKQILSQARPGSSIEVGLQVTRQPADDSDNDNDNDIDIEDDSDDSDESEGSKPGDKWLCSFEIIHTFFPGTLSGTGSSSPTANFNPLPEIEENGPTQEKPSDPYSDALDVTKPLLDSLHMSLIDHPPSREGRLWRLNAMFSRARRRITKPSRSKKKSSSGNAKEPLVGRCIP